MTALLAIWLFIAALITLTAAAIALLEADKHGDHDTRRTAARIALTGWAWPLYAIIGVRWMWRWATEKEGEG